MRTSSLVAAGRPLPTRPSRAFTLVELLVVIAIIAILASLLMPAILNAISSGQTSACMTNLRQIAQAWTNYSKDYGGWMVSGGNRSGQHPGDANQERPWHVTWNKSSLFPYWYESLQPYINGAARDALARKSLVDHGNASPSRDQVRAEIARLCGIYTCPVKNQTIIGYGYHYNAPFGNSACYPNRLCPNFRWPCGKGDALRDHPVFHYPGGAAPPPIPWYAPNVSSSAITTPSNQIVVCDTGWVTNDSDATRDPVEWKEHAKSNSTGYVRFPLHDTYTKTSHYRTKYPWRPVPRHRDKTASVMFDASARAIPIRDIINHPWGDPKCLFDNRPPYRPAVGPDPH